MRCFFQATRLVLFMLQSPLVSSPLLLHIVAIGLFKFDLWRILHFALALTRIVTILAGIFFLITVVAQHTVPDIGADRLASALSREADAPDHIGMLVDLPNDDAH